MSCARTHLTSFGMLGNFSFGGPDYRVSCEMWTRILRDLGVPTDPIHVHPDREDHKRIWRELGHEVVDDPGCVWTDGLIGGHCCEVYSGGVEIGNLVKPTGPLHGRGIRLRAAADGVGEQGPRR